MAEVWMCLPSNSDHHTITIVMPEIPLNITHLDCSNQKSINYFPNLTGHTNLRWLKCSAICHHGGDNLGLFSKLPDSLEYLDCSSNDIWEMDAPLPSQLKFLDISYTKIRKIRALPPGLETLICTKNSLLHELPSPLPLTLRKLYLSNCSLSSLPSIPLGLEVLDVLCNELETLPDLPESVSSLSCAGNYGLRIEITATSKEEVQRFMRKLRRKEMIIKELTTEEKSRDEFDTYTYWMRKLADVV